MAIGEHVCQDYEAGSQVFLNRTWHGGRCQPLCDDASGTAATDCKHKMRWRDPNSPLQCLHTMCFESEDALLQHVARSAYQAFQLARSNVSGLYSDSVDLLAGKGGNMGATGVTGLGLIAEVVADALSWEPRASQQQKVIRTLSTVLGETEGVEYPRSPQGFSVHFLDRDSGKSNDQNSCMMCTGLLQAGINFATSFYESQDPESAQTKQILDLSQRIWNSTHFDRLLCDSSSRNESTSGTGIPMVQSFDGSCSAVQFPSASDGAYEFNEEHYTVWFAYAKDRSSGSSRTRTGTDGETPLEVMWDRWQKRRTCPNHSYKEHKLLSMWSGYLVQLPYYTTASFSTDPTYGELFENHWLADWEFYNDTAHAGRRGRYGLGAGTVPKWCTAGSGYTADRILGGTSYCRMISPYITAGYMPNDAALIKSQLLALLEDGDTVIAFDKATSSGAAAGSTTTGDNKGTRRSGGEAEAAQGDAYHVMWRASMLDYTWIQGYGVTMVDFSSELFGLSTLWLPKTFYSDYGTLPETFLKHE